MAVGNGIGGTSFYAVAAENAPVVIDVVHGSISFGAADPVLCSVLGRFYVYAIRRAGSSAKKASHAFFQAIFVALQNVKTAKTFLKSRSAQRASPVGIVLHYRRLKHLPEGDRHTFGDGPNVLHDRHISNYTFVNFSLRVGIQSATLSTNCMPRIFPSRRRTTTFTTLVSRDPASTILMRIFRPGSRDCANGSDVISTFIPFPLTCDNKPSSRPVSSYTRASSGTTRRGNLRRLLLDFT